MIAKFKVIFGIKPSAILTNFSQMAGLLLTAEVSQNLPTGISKGRKIYFYKPYLGI